MQIPELATKRTNKGKAPLIKNAKVTSKSSGSPKKRTNARNGGRVLSTMSTASGKQNVSQTGWQKFWSGFKKALGVGEKVGEFLLPLIGTRGMDGSYGSIVSSSRIGGSKSVQLSSGMIGLAQATSIPGSSHPIITSGKNGHYTFCHSGIIDSINVPANTQRGDELFKIDLSPIKLEQWLSQMSNFEKYRFKHVFITYKPTCAATEDGTLAGFFEWDIDDPLNLGQGEDTLRDVMAHESANLGNVWNSISWHFSGGDEPNELYFVDPAGNEPRLTTQGVFTLVAGSDFSTAIDAGQLLVAYEIDFVVPELRSNSTGAYAFYRAYTDIGGLDLFGTDIVQVPIKYTDPYGVVYNPPMNVNCKVYNYDNGGIAEGFGQLPYGFWSVQCLVTGTTLSALDLVMYGSYAFLQVTSNIKYTETDGTGANISGLMFSSGITNDDPLSQPASCFGAECAYATMTTVTWIFTRLNGLPPAVRKADVTAILNELANRMKTLEGTIAWQTVADREREWLDKQESEPTKFAHKTGQTCPCLNLTPKL